MNWSTLIPIIAQYGVPFAEKVFQKWSSNAVPTQADFDELRALAGQTALDRMKAQLIAAGVGLDNPTAIKLMQFAS